MTSNLEFNITRIFNAPRDVMWEAWTNPKLFAKWFGPKGFECKILKYELKPSGVAHSRLKSPNGIEMWGKFVYREVEAPSKLVWVHSFSDEGGVNLTRHPFNPDWPLELLTTVTFEEQGNKTKLSLTWVPTNANENEIKVFEAGIEGMNMGWGGTFEQLDSFLASK